MIEPGPLPVRALLVALLVGGPLGARPSPLPAQEGDTEATLAGAVLGLYSGSLLGLAGSVVPCAQLYATRACARAGSVVGAAVGGISGALLGDADAAAVDGAGADAAYGALAGAIVGVAARHFIYYYDWGDVLAFTGLGSAIAPVWEGAGVGLVAGGALGFGLYLISPSVELTDALALGGVGLAVGGLVAWAVKAGEARSRSDDSVPSMTVNLLTLRF